MSIELKFTILHPIPISYREPNMTMLLISYREPTITTYQFHTESLTRQCLVYQGLIWLSVTNLLFRLSMISIYILCPSVSLRSREWTVTLSHAFCQHQEASPGEMHKLLDEFLIQMQNGEWAIFLSPRFSHTMFQITSTAEALPPLMVHSSRFVNFRVQLCWPYWIFKAILLVLGSELLHSAKNTPCKTKLIHWWTGSMYILVT